MRLEGSAPAAVILSVLALACGGSERANGPNGPDGDDEPAIFDLVGSWTATSLLFTNEADPSESVDPIQLGGTAELTISASGAWTYVRNYPGEPIEITTGTLYFEDGFLVVVDDEVPDDPSVFLMTISDGLLTLQGESEFDFDGDGVLEPAFAYYEFEAS